MMLRRRTPNASPGARGSLIRKPSSSGPRWRSASAIVRTQDSASAARLVNATPQIPHTLLLYIGRANEGHSRSDDVLSQVKPGNPQPVVCIPGKYEAQDQTKN